MKSQSILNSRIIILETEKNHIYTEFLKNYVLRHLKNILDYFHKLFFWQLKTKYY